MTIKQIIKSIQEKEIDSSALWAYPIADELKNYSYKLVLEWTIRCIKIYISKFKPFNSTKLEKYIQEVVSLENSLSPSSCDEMGKKVWYSPKRDNVQSAIAYVWWIISQFKLGENYSGVMETTMAIGLSLPDTSDDDLLNKYLEAAINTFSKYKSFEPPFD